MTPEQNTQVKEHNQASY